MAAHSFALLSPQIPVQFLDSPQLSLNDLANEVKAYALAVPHSCTFVSFLVNEVEMLKLVKVKDTKGVPFAEISIFNVRSNLA